MNIPYSCQFEIESGCTHQCGHCYNGSFLETRPSKPAPKEIIDAIAQMNFFEITITGGEPLMSLSTFKYALNSFRNSNMTVLLNSNLHLLDTDILRLFKDFELSCILTSILGPTAKIHDSFTKNIGSFDRLMNSLNIVIENDIKCAANMVIQDANKNHIYETGEMLVKNLGIHAFCATPVVCSPENNNSLMLTNDQYKRVLDELISLSNDYGLFVDVLNPTLPCQFDSIDERMKYSRFIKDRSCGGGRGTLTISVDGDVRPCSHSHNVYGNILEHSIEQILDQMDDWTKKKLIPTDCESCTYISHCKGGCRVSASSVNGSINSKHPYMTKPILDVEEGVFDKKTIINLPAQLTAANGSARIRKEAGGVFIIYINTKSNGLVDRFGLEIFRRFKNGKTREEIILTLNAKYFDQFNSAVHYLFERGLLVENEI